MKNVYWHSRFKAMLDYIAGLIPPKGKIKHGCGKNKALEGFRASANKYYNFYKKGELEDSETNHATELIDLLSSRNEIKRMHGLSLELLLLLDGTFGEIAIEAYYEQCGGLIYSREVSYVPEL